MIVSNKVFSPTFWRQAWRWRRCAGRCLWCCSLISSLEIQSLFSRNFVFTLFLFSVLLFLFFSTSSKRWTFFRCSQSLFFFFRILESTILYLDFFCFFYFYQSSKDGFSFHVVCVGVFVSFNPGKWFKIIKRSRSQATFHLYVGRACSSIAVSAIILSHFGFFWIKTR